MCSAGVVSAQSSGHQTAPFASAVETLESKLKSDYVFPDVGQEYALALGKHLAAGDYSGINERDQIATRLTADLQAFKPEGHLRVRAIGAVRSSPTKASSDAPPPIAEAKWVASGVAYISFTLMPDDPQVIATNDRFMREHASARVLIIDARANHGGGEGVPSTIFKYLYAGPTALDFLDERTGVNDDTNDDPYEQPPRVTKVQGPPGIIRSLFTVFPDPAEHRLFHAKVFYLTSSKTGSAAEQMAEALKRTHRATIVGERTAGAGHFGFFVPIGQGLEAFIPWGRVINPVNGEDYEGRGVTPDLAVPADQALAQALKIVGAPEQRTSE
ncbi:MAG: S41 family peptidase [Caulobacteraceae bacterium]